MTGGDAPGAQRSATGPDMGVMASGLSRPWGGNRLEVRRAALSRLREALDDLGVAAWPAPGTAPVLSLWPGLHVGVSLDGTRYGWTVPGFPGEVATCPVDDVASVARRIAGRLDELLGVAGWLA